MSKHQDTVLPQSVLSESLDRQFAEYLKRACSILPPLYIAVIVLSLFYGQQLFGAANLSRMFSICLCTGAWLALRNWHPQGWAHAIGTLLVVCFMTNYFVLDVVSGGDYFVTQVALAIIAIGAIFLSKLWFVIAQFVAVAFCLAYFQYVDGPLSRAFDAPTPFGVLALALILFVVRRNLHKNFEALQWRRGQQKLELERAVEAAQREMREREQAQAALRASEERYREFIEGTEDLVTRVDPDGKIAFVNHTSRSVFGLEPEECKGRQFSDFIDPADRAAAMAFFEEWISAKVASATLENRVDGVDGAQRTMLWSVNLTYDPCGHVEAINLIGRDITQLRKAEEALRANEAQYRGIFEASTDGLIIHDAEARVVEANPAMCAMHGYTREEFIGMRPEEFIHPDSLGDFRLHLAATRKGKPFHCYGFDVRKDGSKFPVEVHGSSLVYNGEPHHLGIVRDISDRVEAEEQRRMLEEQVQQAQKLESLGLLAGGIAHDFNNLLTGIMGNASLAASEIAKDAPVQDTITQIEVAAQRAAELCRQMLAYSGRGRFVVQPINISSLVTEMAALLQSSVTKKATLLYELDARVPAVDADATQLRQVVMNLIINASEALDEREGVITLRTGLRRCDERRLRELMFGSELTPGEYVFLEVSDSGHGMDPETADHIFDPFFTTKFTGRGLGLAAVLGIVRGHYGAIKLDTAVERGTTFTIYFPPSKHAVVDVPNADAKREPWAGRGTILVVDDEHAVADVAEKTLTRAGFDVLVARDGQEAVDVFRERGTSLDLVVLDLTMPRMSGEEVLQIMQGVRPELPIILSSGFSEQEAVSRFADQRLAGFLHKPYRAQELVLKVREALENASFEAKVHLEKRTN